jgi:hypothetical protein
LIYLIIFLRPIITLDAYEIEAECVEVGCKLFPWVNWSTGIPFIAIDALEGQYDLVLCNPPIGINRGVEPGKMMCNHRASRSEHLFLELSIRALKSGGQAVILGSANYLESCSARLRTWIQQQQVVIAPPLGPLPGSNRYSSLQLYAYYISHPGGEIVEGSKQIIFKTQPKEIEFKHE